MNEHETVSHEDPATAFGAALAEIKAILWRLVFATLALYIGTLGFVFLFILPRANESQTALCALRSDLTTRIAAGQDFLDAHPDGAFGASAASIQQSIDNQQRTVSALSGLSC